MRRLSGLALFAFAVLVLSGAVLTLLSGSAFAQGNPCSDEFQGLMQKHQTIMQSLAALQKSSTKKPANFEEARERASSACSKLTPAVTSFERLNAWAGTNKEFCMLPEKLVSDLSAGLANIKKSRASACGAVAQLDSQKKKAEQAGSLGGGPQLPAGQKAGVIANDPFNPRVLRRPQIDTPGT